jgi:hypothetical protein
MPPDATRGTAASSTPMMLENPLPEDVGASIHKNEVPLTDEIIATLHNLTQGIPELATILYKTAQETVIGEQEAVTIEVLRETSQEYFKLVHPFLSELRGQNKSDLVM